MNACRAQINRRRDLSDCIRVWVERSGRSVVSEGANWAGSVMAQAAVKQQHAEYNTRLIKGGASLHDVRLLVRGWEAGSAREQTERGVRANVLAKGVAAAGQRCFRPGLFAAVRAWAGAGGVADRALARRPGASDRASAAPSTIRLIRVGDATAWLRSETSVRAWSEATEAPQRCRLPPRSSS